MGLWVWGLGSGVLGFREACKSILSFLKDALEVGRTNPDFHSSVNVVLVPRGPGLVLMMLAGLAGALPEHRIDDVSKLTLSFCGGRNRGVGEEEWRRG